MKRLNPSRTTLAASLALIGGSLLAHPSGAQAAAAADEGAQAQARALLAPQVRSAASGARSEATAGERVSARDAVQLAQRFILGTADVHADRPESSAAQANAPGRLRLAGRRHYADPHELIRRTILGQRA